MYVIIDKKSRAILHQSNSRPGMEQKPEELMPGYDPKTMLFARATEHFLPVRFDIKDGLVVDLDPPKVAAPPPAPTLTDLKARKKKEITKQALFQREALAPDYHLLNAGLGLYDETRVATLKATVNAFRDEVNRVEAAIAKAKSAKELEAVKPAFPVELVIPKASKPAKTK